MIIVSKGAVEITLLGQNVSAYHGLDYEKREIGIAQLIEHLAKIPNLKRIRYSTSHPNDMLDDLALLHKTEAKLMPSLHLPVQSGSDKILKDMNRKHTAEEYIQIIEKYRASRPDIIFSSDFIVGYPGETEQDFEATMELVRKVKFAYSFSFKYSMRPGTPAAAMDNQIPEEIKNERLARLQALLSQQQEEFNLASIGTMAEVLFEREGKFEGQILGKNIYGQPVCVTAGKENIGKILPVKITSLVGTTLSGNLLD